jgi:hypothetical protein
VFSFKCRRSVVWGSGRTKGIRGFDGFDGFGKFDEFDGFRGFKEFHTRSVLQCEETATSHRLPLKSPTECAA